MDRVTGLQPLSGPRKGAPCVIVNTFDKVHVTGHIGADFISRGPHALQGSRQDARVIEDEDIARGQVFRQVPHAGIFQPSVTVHDQKTRGILRVSRSQRNQAFRQIEMKVGKVHGRHGLWAREGAGS